MLTAAPDDLLLSASGGCGHVPGDWMPAAAVRSLVANDPACLWLDLHGATHGFEPDDGPGSFHGLIQRKEQEFQRRWLAEFFPEAVPVCRQPGDALRLDRLRHTLALLRYPGDPGPSLDSQPPGSHSADAAPAGQAIAFPALWWAPARLHGAPPLLARAHRLRRLLPASALDSLAALDLAPPHAWIPVYIKLKSTLETSRLDLNMLAAEAALHARLLGFLQNFQPAHAFVFCRNRIDDPLSVSLAAMESRLNALRDLWDHIARDGHHLRPWRDAAVQIDFRHRDLRWARAKQRIATQLTPGQDPTLLAHITRQHTPALAAAGFSTLDSILACDPERLPLHLCPALEHKHTLRIRNLVRAHRSGRPIRPARPPRPRPCELFIDFEFFPSLHIDFERQWPGLEGMPMLFMAGCGRVLNGRFDFDCFIAPAESASGEARLVDDWLACLTHFAGDPLLDPEQTVLYHWSSAEPVHARKCADRLGLPADHPLRQLPWEDLEHAWLREPCAVPGAFKASLKTVATALEQWQPGAGQTWPSELDAGVDAILLGWRAYQQPQPAATPEMRILRDYLHADCRALAQILRWMRAPA